MMSLCSPSAFIFENSYEQSPTNYHASIASAAALPKIPLPSPSLLHAVNNAISFVLGSSSKTKNQTNENARKTKQKVAQI
jgi:hypothetical protein